MAKDGRAPQALATAAIGAFIGGIIATTIVVFFAPRLAELAVLFGPGEYFALAIFAFVATASVVSDSVTKGLSALVIGLALAVIGIDGISGAGRFTLGVPELFDGVSIIVITVGILALGEVFHVASRIHRDPVLTAITISKRPYLSRAEFREALPAWLRGTAFGVPFGVIPVGGAEVPTFMAYGTERSLDRRRRFPQFGKGAIRGVAGPEAAGNATSGTAMGALLALGLPTSATAAIMLAAFQQYGLQPGPLLFERSPDLVWALLASLFVGLVMLLILNLPFAPLWAKLILVPKPYLYAGISVFCALGVYATSAAVSDLLLVFGIGFIGFLLRRYGFPLAPVMIGVVLGPLAETSLRNALMSTGGDASVLISSGISITLYGILALVVIYSIARKIRARKMQDV
jgi:putative tricarboxylic transport membrane protein